MGESHSVASELKHDVMYPAVLIDLSLDSAHVCA